MEKIINQDIRNFVNITAHPAGCEQNVRAQIDYSLAACPGSGVGNALVIGSSAGYGLASIITAVFGYGANGLGIYFEKPIKNRRSASPGAYNIEALHKIAREKGRHLETLNGDAFSHAMRDEAIAILKSRYGKLDYIIYSLASSRRIDPDNGNLYKSSIKPIGKAFTTKTIDPETDMLRQITVEPALETETSETVKVMGGEDWELWVKALTRADLLNPGCRIIAYTYIGSEATAPIYRSGTIGAAKMHLEHTALELDKLLAAGDGGSCRVCSCQAQVTRASSVIPAMPLYISLLKKAMAKYSYYESAIEQITRLFKKYIAPGIILKPDTENIIRLDDRELAPAVQEYIMTSWEKLTNENLQECADWPGFKADFARTAGFGIPGVDYSREVAAEINW